MAKLPQIEGRVWIGTHAVNLDELKDKVVLIDFWTYSCVNCARTLPYLREWYGKYKDHGLVIIGIHTPEFEFEKDPKNVEHFMQEHAIMWPVLLDNEHLNWDNFSNQYWPTKYLADSKGHIVYTHSGEGAYKETEQKIRELLGIKNPEEREEWEEHDDHKHGNVCGIATAETYCGYLRGFIGNQLGYAEDTEEAYTHINANTEEGKLRLHGPFLATSEYLESRSHDASITLACRGTEINLVMSHSGKEAIVQILWNREVMSNEVRGKDVEKDGSLIVNRSGMFNLLRAEREMVGTIEVKASHGNFRAYAFTFSGCTDNI